MLRTFIPALALALVPLTAAAPPAAAADETETIVAIPGATEVPLTFTLEEVPEDIALVILGPVGIGDPQPLTDVVAGENTIIWDAAGLADGDYVATLVIDGVPSDDVLNASVRVNLDAPTVTAPRLSRTSIFPVRDGYRDYVRISSAEPVSETPATTRVEVLNRYGSVVWRSSTTNPTWWWGRGFGGRTLTPGTFRVRTVAVDADGLRAVSPARTITLSPKKLVTVKASAVLNPRRYMLRNPFTGTCGKVITPARRGKAWRGSVGLSSNHRCTRRGAKSGVETDFGAIYRGALVYKRVKIKVNSAGHRKRSDRAVAFTLRKKGSGVTAANIRRLGAKKKWRTIADLRGTQLKRHVNNGFFYWGTATFEGSRHDVRRFKLVSVQKVLIDPRTTSRTAPGGFAPARTPAVGGRTVLR